MRHVRSVRSRGDVEKLDPVARGQLAAAGLECLGPRGKTLDDVLAWCDRELVPWAVFEASVPGEGDFVLWMLGSDDGTFFRKGETEALGIGVSQGGVSDMVANRDALVQALDRELESADDVPYVEWDRGR